MASDAIIGFASSAIALSITYPADTFSRNSQVTSSRVDLKKFTPKSAFKGLTPALATQPLYWAIYTPLYERTKVGYVAGDMLAGFSAGALATVVTNPLWMLRQRMQTELLKNKNNSYRKLIREIHAENGIQTFFRGTSVTLLKNIQMAFIFPIFDRLQKHQIWGETPQILSSIGSGVIAKIAASTVVYEKIIGLFFTVSDLTHRTDIHWMSFGPICDLSKHRKARYILFSSKLH